MYLPSSVVLHKKIVLLILLAFQLGVFTSVLKAQIRGNPAGLAKTSVVDRIMEDYRYAIRSQVMWQMKQFRDGGIKRDFAHIPEVGLSIDFENLLENGTPKYSEYAIEVQKFLKTKRSNLYKTIIKMEKAGDFFLIAEKVSAIADRLTKHEATFGANLKNWDLVARQDLLNSFDKLMILYWYKKNTWESHASQRKIYKEVLFYTAALISGGATVPLMTFESSAVASVAAIAFVSISSLVTAKVASIFLEKFEKKMHEDLFLDRLGIREMREKADNKKSASEKLFVLTGLGEDVMDISISRPGCKNALRLSQAMEQP